MYANIGETKPHALGPDSNRDLLPHCWVCYVQPSHKSPGQHLAVLPRHYEQRRNEPLRIRRQQLLPSTRRLQVRLVAGHIQQYLAE